MKEDSSRPFLYIKEALDLIIRAIKNSGYQQKIEIGLDCVASQFFKKGNYELDKTIFTREDLLTFYRELVKKYPILSIEDLFLKKIE
ncbi:hypothetical protein LCGC14_0509770 [marine sediment metagenome]|uniref:phosphopyruvate hydratase n=1 Tax=marine sediment metagenome TaxID=412755 RepID=A0A0F9S6A2_9ZZZZ